MTTEHDGNRVLLQIAGFIPDTNLPFKTCVSGLVLSSDTPGVEVGDEVTVFHSAEWKDGNRCFADAYRGCHGFGVPQAFTGGVLALTGCESVNDDEVEATGMTVVADRYEAFAALSGERIPMSGPSEWPEALPPLRDGFLASFPVAVVDGEFLAFDRNGDGYRWSAAEGAPILSGEIGWTVVRPMSEAEAFRASPAVRSTEPEAEFAPAP